MYIFVFIVCVKWWRGPAGPNYPFNKDIYLSINGDELWVYQYDPEIKV